MFPAQNKFGGLSAVRLSMLFGISVFGVIGIWCYWYLVLLVFGVTGIGCYCYFVLLVFGLVGI